MNINNFFDYGFETSILDKNFLMKFKTLISLEEWTEIFDGEFFVKIPKWMKNFVDNKNKINKYCTINKEIPKIYHIIFNNIIKDSKNICYLDSFYDLEIKNIQLWNGVTDNKYHWDGPGNQDIFLLLYLSDFDEWNPSNGGGIKVGIRDLPNNQNWSTISNENDIKEISTIYPDNGRFVLGNNMNPKFVHKPFLLNDNSLNRYTFLITIKLNNKYFSY